MPIRFGTDGWRAVIGDEFTFANVGRVARAVAQFTLGEATGQQQANGAAAPAAPALVVGYDTRFLSREFAVAVAEVLAAHGVRVLLTRESTPTPVVSYGIVHFGAQGGVMVTASHNPPRYNGIKLKGAFGGSAPPAANLAVERLLRADRAPATPVPRVALADAVAQGWVHFIEPFIPYAAHLRTLVDFESIARGGLSVVVDPMHGAGRGVLARLLQDAGCRVREIRGEWDPGFGGVHPEPIARHLQPLFAAAQESGVHLAVATDGDADRVGAADAAGRFIDPHAIMSLITDYLVQVRGLRGSIVKTVSTTRMLNLLARRYDLPIHETPVGFNHIADRMRVDQVLIGGEESGGISMQGHIPEGDGLLMALLLAELVAHYGRDLGSQLADLMARPDMGHFVYARRDQSVPPFDKAELVGRLMALLPDDLAGHPLRRADDRDGVKYILQDESWLLIRPSGTEPVLRIYAESHSPAQVDALIEAGVEMAAGVVRGLGAPER